MQYKYFRRFIVDRNNPVGFLLVSEYKADEYLNTIYNTLETKYPELDVRKVSDGDISDLDKLVKERLKEARKACLHVTHAKPVVYVIHADKLDWAEFYSPYVCSRAANCHIILIGENLSSLRSSKIYGSVLQCIHGTDSLTRHTVKRLNQEYTEELKALEQGGSKCRA